MLKVGRLTDSRDITQFWSLIFTHCSTRCFHTRSTSPSLFSLCTEARSRSVRTGSFSKRMGVFFSRVGSAIIFHPPQPRSASVPCSSIANTGWSQERSRNLRPSPMDRAISPAVSTAAESFSKESRTSAVIGIEFAAVNSCDRCFSGEMS